ncbi:hypothetical protein IFM89_018205 [Coptis chinensis]|uniref:Uncharacterized protein n=1 Tax=Coptis chinensis TaxID=261450 RepID=A0A835LYJ6_9MAGN|nr:hypothetical protein IFM89_018205 [Coptis chinensis]
MLMCEISFPEKLWEKHHQALGDDMLFQYRRINGNQTLILSEEKIKNYTLCEIEIIMLRRGKTLAKVNDFPFPNMKDQMPTGNRLIAGELDYDCRSLRDE